MPTPLQTILESYRASSQTEREKGSYFEELIHTYLRFEASYADLYSEVWLFADWVKEIGGPQYGFNARDTGIDLVAQTHGTGEFHAIQCKCFAPTYQSGIPLHIFAVCSDAEVGKSGMPMTTSSRPTPTSCVTPPPPTPSAQPLR